MELLQPVWQPANPQSLNTATNVNCLDSFCNLFIANFIGSSMPVILVLGVVSASCKYISIWVVSSDKVKLTVRNAWGGQWVGPATVRAKNFMKIQLILKQSATFIDPNWGKQLKRFPLLPLAAKIQFHKFHYFVPSFARYQSQRRGNP